MTCLNEKQQQALTTLVYDYLQGEKIPLVRSFLDKNCAEQKQDANILYEAVPVHPVTAQRLFVLLHVPKEKQSTYANVQTLLTLLTSLHQDGYAHDHLAYLLGLIEQTKYKRSGRTLLMFGALLSTGLGGVFYLKPDYFNALNQLITAILPRIVLGWLKKTFSLLRNLPLLGIVYTCSSLISHTYRTVYYGGSNFSQKWAAFSFKATSISLSLAGYVLCFLAAGVATPVSGILFITSSTIDVAESFFTFYLINQKPRPKRESLEKTWEALADHTRNENQQQRASQSIWVKLTAATLITAAVTIWCVFPPSLFIMLSCMAFITLVGFIKSAMVERIDTAAATALQASLASIDAPMTSLTIPSPQHAVHGPLVLASQHHNSAPLTKEKQQTYSASYATTGTARASFFSPSNSPQGASNDDPLAKITGLTL